MATLRRGLVDKVKKAAAKVSTRGKQVAAQAGTRGARVVVETAVAAVKTVDKLQEKLGRRPSKAATTKEPMMGERLPEAVTRQPVRRASKPAGATAKPRREAAGSTRVAQPVAVREAGRKTMPAAAPKRSKAAQAPRKQFKVKRGQKHLHSGR